jgi:hypothetical protein
MLIFSGLPKIMPQNVATLIAVTMLTKDTSKINEVLNVSN